MKRLGGVHSPGRCWVAMIGLCFLGVAAAFGQGGAPQLAPASDEAIELFSTAANAQNSGEFELAAELWADFLKQYPALDLTPQAEHYCGVCNLQLKRYEAAAQHFQAVVTKWSQLPKFALTQDAYLNLGWCRYCLAGQAQAKGDRAKLYEQAAATFAALVQRFPGGKYTDQALYFQGEALYHLNKKKEALAPYGQLVRDKKLQRSSLRANAVYALGVTHEELGQYADAGAVYDLFLKEFPKHELVPEVRMRKAETVLQAGLAAKKQGRGQQAKQQIEQAAKMFAEVAKTPGFDTADHALFQQALCQVQLDHAAQAADLYAQIPTRFANSAYVKEAALNAGRFYYRAGAYDAALKWLQQVIDKDPASAPEASHWACRIYLRNNEPAKAARLAEKVLPQAAGSNFLVYLQMDQADGLYAMAQRKSESIDLYVKIAEDHPQHDLAPEALYNAAYAALELKKYDVGSRHCETFLKRYPGNSFAPDVKYVAAECHLHRKQYAEAEAIYRELTSQHTGHADLPQWQVRLGLALYLQEKYAATVDWLTPLLDRFQAPEAAAEARFLVGASQFRLAKYDAAIQQFEASLAANPKWHQTDETLLLWSQSLHALKRTDEAIQIVQRLIRDFADSQLLDQAHYRHGQYSYARGDFKTAASQYHTVTDRWPSSPLAPYAYYGEGWSLLKQESYPQAVETFTAMLQKYPTHALAADARLARGMCRRQTKDFQGAVADIAAFLKSNPGKPDKCNGLYEKGLAEVALQDYPAAIRSFTELLQVDPKCAIADKALYELAWALKSDKQDAEALANFRRLIREHPDSPLAAEAHFHDGEDLYRQKKYGEAAKAYQLAKQKAAPGDLQEKTIYKLGWAYYQQDQFQPALRQFEQQVKAYAQGSLKADALFMLAECLFRMKDYAKALPAFRTARAAADASSTIAENVRVAILLHGGQSALELKRYDDALALLKPIPAEHPDSSYVAEAYLEIGRATQGLGQNSNAVTAYEQAATKSLGEVGARARFMIGEIYFAAKRYDEATKQFQRVIFGYSRDPNNPKINNWKAKSAYETARCAEVRIAAATQPATRSKLVANAKKFYNYVVTKYPQHPLAGEAQKRLQVLAKLKP